MCESLNKVIGLTGTPGTGKKSVGRKLSEILGREYLNLNQASLLSGAIIGKDPHGFVVDTKKLKAYLKKELRSRSIVVGHLLPFVLNRREVELVIVLRCSPFELDKRLSERNYSKEKIRQNVEAEILDLCLYEAVRRFGIEKVAEFDTSGRKVWDVTQAIAKSVKQGPKPGIHIVDWLSKIIDLGMREKYLPKTP